LIGAFQEFTSAFSTTLYRQFNLKSSKLAKAVYTEPFWGEIIHAPTTCIKNQYHPLATKKV
jgi:hypothetical protein